MEEMKKILEESIEANKQALKEQKKMFEETYKQKMDDQKKAMDDQKKAMEEQKLMYEEKLSKLEELLGQKNDASPASKVTSRMDEKLDAEFTMDEFESWEEAWGVHVLLNCINTMPHKNQIYHLRQNINVKYG